MPEVTQPGGFVSTWLSAQQEHAVGHKALFDIIDGEAHRGEEWTDDNRSGDLARSPWQVLLPGEYTALFQVYSRHAGKPVGRLIAEDDQGHTLAECQVITGPVEFGDWQRVVISFRLPAATRTRIRFHYDQGTSLWTGLIHLTRSGRRPIYVIGHNRNTPEQADLSLQMGANALEVDLSYRDKRLMAAEVPPLPGWEKISEAGEWLRHAKDCGDRWAFLYIDCKLHQVPGNDFYQYGTLIARTIEEAGVDPKKCMFSIPDKSAVELHKAAKEHGFADSSFAIDGIDNNHPVFSKPEDWAAAAMEYQLQVIGMGRAAIEIIKPLPLWWQSVAATTVARDSGQPYPHNVIFWSLHEKDGMRKILDLGVDGIIADQEDHLCAVLEEEAYQKFCRKAEPSEWDPFHSFGIS